MTGGRRRLALRCFVLSDQSAHHTMSTPPNKGKKSKEGAGGGLRSRWTAALIKNGGIGSAAARAIGTTATPSAVA